MGRPNNGFGKVSPIAWDHVISSHGSSYPTSGKCIVKDILIWNFPFKNVLVYDKHNVARFVPESMLCIDSILTKHISLKWVIGQTCSLFWWVHVSILFIKKINHANYLLCNSELEEPRNIVIWFEHLPLYQSRHKLLMTFCHFFACDASASLLLLIVNKYY